MSIENEKKSNWSQFFDYYKDHEYNENYFFMLEETREYVKETGKLPYKKGETPSKDYQDWQEKWNLKKEEKWLKMIEREKSQLSYWIKNKRVSRGSISLIIPPNLEKKENGIIIDLPNDENKVKKILKDLNIV